MWCGVTGSRYPTSLSRGYEKGGRGTFLPLVLQGGQQLNEESYLKLGDSKL